MDGRVDGIVEIFTWVGFGLGAVIAGIALVMYLLDGTWVPAHAVLVDTDGGRVARWFAEGGVGEAALTHEQEHALAGRAEADVFVRAGTRDRMRLTRGSRAVASVAWLAVGLIGVGVAGLVVSIVLLIIRG